jgi:thiol-disulfide isomerase/thioredoxin
MNRPVRGSVVALAFILLGTAGCSSNLGGTGDKGYVGGSGGVSTLPPSERTVPGDVAGDIIDPQSSYLKAYATQVGLSAKSADEPFGTNVNLRQFRGKVVVINVWGSWCPPCRSEAANLVKAAEKLAAQGVVFLGINTRDLSEDNAAAFQRERKVPYPSIYDPGGRNLLAFRGTLSPATIPSTVIIDAQGRVAASILGEVTSATTLIDLVAQVSK